MLLLFQAISTPNETLVFYNQKLLNQDCSFQVLEVNVSCYQDHAFFLCQIPNLNFSLKLLNDLDYKHLYLELIKILYYLKIDVFQIHNRKKDFFSNDLVNYYINLDLEMNILCYQFIIKFFNVERRLCLLYLQFLYANKFRDQVLLSQLLTNLFFYFIQILQLGVCSYQKVLFYNLLDRDYCFNF